MYKFLFIIFIIIFYSCNSENNKNVDKKELETKINEENKYKGLSPEEIIFKIFPKEIIDVNYMKTNNEKFFGFKNGTFTLVFTKDESKYPEEYVKDGDILMAKGIIKSFYYIQDMESIIIVTRLNNKVRNFSKRLVDDPLDNNLTFKIIFNNEFSDVLKLNENDFEKFLNKIDKAKARKFFKLFIG